MFSFDMFSLFSSAPQLIMSTAIVPFVPNKRQRTMSSSSSKAKMARAIAARLNKRFPYKDYGRAYFKRGTELTREKFGPSYKEATEAQRISRRTMGYYGRGKYSLRKFARSGVGRALARAGRGALVGGLTAVDPLLGAAAGSYLGQGLYEGQGSYTSNQLIEGSSHMPVSGSFANDETGSVTYTARQFVRIINAPGSSSFQNTRLPINPGVAEIFPWLSGVAQNFEEYKFNQLVFEIQSTLDTNGLQTSGQSGTLVMLVDYNQQDLDFINPEAMLQYHGSVSGKITDDLRCGVELEPGKGRSDDTRFVRSSPVPLDQDQDEYDLGSLHIAFNNVPTALQNQQIGYLWVYYSVTLMKPKLAKSRGEDIQVWRGGCTVAGGNSDHWGPLDANNVPTAFVVSQQNTIPMKFAVDKAFNADGRRFKLTFPSWFTGDVEVKWFVEGPGIAPAAGPTLTTYGTGSQITPLKDIYASNANSNALGDEPDYFIEHQATGSGYMYIGHFRVRSAVGGNENVLLIDKDFTTGGGVQQHYIDVAEYNTSGHISNTNNRLKWVTYNDHTLVGDMNL